MARCQCWNIQAVWLSSPWQCGTNSHKQILHFAVLPDYHLIQSFHALWFIYSSTGFEPHWHLIFLNLCLFVSSESSEFFLHDYLSHLSAFDIYPSLHSLSTIYIHKWLTKSSPPPCQNLMVQIGLSGRRKLRHFFCWQALMELLMLRKSQLGWRLLEIELWRITKCMHTFSSLLSSLTTPLLSTSNPGHWYCDFPGLVHWSRQFG